MDLKEKIVNYISTNSYNKEKVDELFLSLSLENNLFKDFVKTINELDDEGVIYITNQGYIHNASKLNIFLGTIKNIKRYYAICELNNHELITIYNENLKNAYLNDYVRVHINKNDTGEVMDVLKHSLWEIIATYKNHSYIIDDRFFPYELIVSNPKKIHLVDGHIVKLKINSYDDMLIKCEVKELIGHKNDPGMDILKFVIQSGVPYVFDEETLKETNKIINNYQKNLEKELKNRLDLTNELIVTIDGLDAKDLDDAISLKINDNGNFLLGVHIADVSYFVKEDSILDKQAFTRGTSIYLVDRVIPMLPHQLCNDACSLNENEIKLTMSCIMEIDNLGNVIDYEIKPSFIKSNARLDYDDVNNLFEHKSTNKKYTKEIKEMLFMMKRLSDILSKKMLNNGYIQLNIDEAKIIMDDKTNKIIKIEKRISKAAEKLIENFMILANETVASHIFYLQLPFIYRVHAPIEATKMSTLISELQEIDASIHLKTATLSSKKLQEILDKFKNKDNEYIVNNYILRSMSKAIYSIDNIGHFGLGSKCYTHFTSPIRRYPDLIVHRFLKKYLVLNDFADKTEFLDQAALNSSVTERRAMLLERDVEDMKKAEYMSDYIGCVYEGIVTGVMDFGYFIKLDNTCEGLLRLENYYNPYYFNDKKTPLKIGNKVMVKVISVNILNGEINFAYAQKKHYNKKGDNRC